MSELKKILNEIELLDKEAQIVNLRITVTGYRLLGLMKGKNK